MERGFPALRGVDLRIEEGELFGILGPNGAGKTTLISILSTILIPTKGEVRILGRDAFKNTKEVRRRINICSGTRLPWGMKVYECLRFYALCYGIRDKSVVEKLLSEFELERYRDVRFDELSAGNKQKLNLARAFVNNPELVFLDEPTANLDPDVARRIREMILELGKDTTIVLTTHNMREAEMLCDRIAFIKEGRIVAEGTAESLKRFVRRREKVIVKFKGEFPEIGTGWPYEVDGKKAVFYVDDAERSVAQIVYELMERGVRVESVRVEEITLEDVFVELAKGN